MARLLDLELVLIPRNLLPAIRKSSSQIPAYQLTDNEDDDDPKISKQNHKLQRTLY